MSYFQQLALNGQCYFGTGPVAGIAIPIQSTTTCRFCLWNPQGSGVNLVLNKLQITKVDAADPGVGGYLLGLLPNAGASPATGSPVATFTDVAVRSAKFNDGQPAPRARFASASTGTTITAATTIFYALGISREVVTDTVGPVIHVFDFNGSLVLAPGAFMHLCGIAADTQVTMSSISWAEVAA
jgi:hypothetical protein